MNTFVLGDGRPYPVQLTINDEVFAIPSYSIVKAQILSEDQKKVLSSAPAECLSTDLGADWDTSKIIVKFSREATASIRNQGSAILEVQVTFINGEDKDDWTWFIPVELEKGHIVE